MSGPIAGEPVDLGRELREFAGDLARQAGELVKAGRRSGAGSVDTKSSGTDLVTQYDRASEALIVGAIRAARPDDAIIGEEGTADEGTSGVRWLIDPIDGTTNFFYDLPGYAVSMDPGFLYTRDNYTFSCNIPWAVRRDRLRSVADIKNGIHGDAAFADYTAVFSLSKRF